MSYALCESLRSISFNIPVIRACNEPISRFVESAVGERENMRAEYLEEIKVLVIICTELLHQLVDQPPQLRLPVST